MPIYIAEVTKEAEVFLGTLASIQSLGGKQTRTSERDAVGESFGGQVDAWIGPDGRVITAGAVYLREVREVSPGVLGTPGSWVYFGQVWEPKVQALNAAVLNRQTAAAAGNPMRNPLGLPVVLPDGTRPTQPLQGEPARDPWTGELTGGTQP